MQSLYELTRPNRTVPLLGVAAELDTIHGTASRLQWAISEAHRQARTARNDAERRLANANLLLAEQAARAWINSLGKATT